MIEDNTYESIAREAEISIKPTQSTSDFKRLRDATPSEVSLGRLQKALTKTSTFKTMENQ